jgi:hypothetical protein
MTPADRSTLSIVVPDDIRFFRPVRLAVGGVATLVGFDVAAIDDLRIGVDELCAALAEGGAGPFQLDIHAEPGRELRIEGRVTHVVGDLDGERFTFSRQILSVVADDFGLEVVDGELRCWMTRGLDDLEFADGS